MVHSNTNRKLSLLQVYHEAAEIFRRNYEGSVEFYWKQFLEVVEDVPKTETGEAIVAPTSLSRFLVWLLFYPLTNQFRNYSWNWFLMDLGASLTNTLILIPCALAYALLAKVSTVNALISCIVPVFLYAFIGNSRQLSIGPDCITSIITGVVIDRELGFIGGTADQIACTLALLVGIFCIILSLLRAGFIDNIISGYLLIGFVTGVALLIISVQLPNLLGISISFSGDVATAQKFVVLFSSIHHIHLPILLVGLGSLLILQLLISLFEFLQSRGMHWFNRIPPVIVLVIISIIVSAVAHLDELGVPIMGGFDHGFLLPKVPPLSIDFISRLSTDAVMIILVGFIQMQSVTRKYSVLNGYHVSGDRELFAIGFANCIGSFFGSYSTFANPSSSRLMKISGSKTNMAGLLTSIFVTVSMYALSPVFYYIPKPTLAAIIVRSALALIQIQEIIFIFRVRSWSEIFMFLTTLVLTFVTAISNGILLCLLLATLIIVRKVSTCDLSILGFLLENEGRRMYLDVKEHSDVRIFEGILPLSIRGPLLFFNTGNLHGTIEMLIKADLGLLEKQKRNAMPLDPMQDANNSFHQSSLSGSEYTQDAWLDFNVDIHEYILLIDFRRCTDIDSASAFILKRIVLSFMSTRSTRVVFTGMHAFHKHLFKKAGLLDILGNEGFDSIEQAIDFIQVKRRDSTNREASQEQSRALDIHS